MYTLLLVISKILFGVACDRMSPLGFGTQEGDMKTEVQVCAFSFFKRPRVADLNTGTKRRISKTAGLFLHKIFLLMVSQKIYL